MIEVTIEKQCAVFTINNPPINALTLKMVMMLSDYISEYECLPYVKGIIITGQGRCFCTGLDISELLDFNEKDLKQYLISFDRLLLRMVHIRKPIIIGINGHSIGGGAVLSLASDHILCLDSQKIKIGFPEYSYGLFFTTIMRCLITKRIKYSSEVFLMGKYIGCKRALSIGIIDELVDKDIQTSAVAICENIISSGTTYLLLRNHFKNSFFNYPISIDDSQYLLFYKILQQHDTRNRLSAILQGK